MKQTIGYVTLMAEKKAEDRLCISHSECNLLGTAREPEGCTQDECYYISW